MSRLAGLTLGLWALLGLWAPAALAQGLSVTPVQVQLGAHARSALVNVHNQRSEPRRYQIKVFAWSQRADGEMELAPTRDVVVFPTLLTVNAGEKRNLRVGTTATPGAAQKTYRIFVEELPPPARPGDSAVQVLTRLGIPVFVAPSGEERVAARVGAPQLKGGTLSVELLNTGTVYVRPDIVEAQALGAGGERLFEHRWQAWYVLAGGTRRYEVKLPAEVCGRVRQLAVRVASAAGDQTQALQTPSGACGP